MAENEKSNNPQSEEEQSVNIQANDEHVANSVSDGVMHDDLDLKKLLFWGAVGIGVLAIFLIALTEFFGFTEFVVNNEASTGQTTLIHELRRQDNKVLNSFGVVNEDKGVYRIPIDSAIDLIAVDSNTK